MVPPIQETAGIIKLCMFFFFTPIYIRLLYIFATKKKYRDLQCYRIMIQMGIIQCLLGPATFFYGLSHLLDYDYANLATFGEKTSLVGVRTEGIMGLCLALNRLNIICKLNCHSMVFTVLLVFAWVFYLTHYIVFLTPLAGFITVPNEYLPKLDLSLPWSAKISAVLGIFYEAILCSTLVIYLILITYIIYTRVNLGKIANLKQEALLMIYALIRFLIDVSLSVFFNFVPLPKHPLTGLVVCLCYITNNLFVPPFLYLCLYKTLRSEFFKLSTGPQVAVVSVKTMRSSQEQTSSRIRS